MKKRASQLEKTKSERKKTSSSFGVKPRKRGSRGGASSSSRPAKSAKTSVYPSSFSRRNAAPLRSSSSARYSGSYNYPSQTMLESSTANPYAVTYGTSHTQSPAGITQQHYSLPADTLVSSGYRSSVSYAGQTSYGTYDYGNAAPQTYQLPYTVDQTSYRG